MGARLPPLFAAAALLSLLRLPGSSAQPCDSLPGVPGSARVRNSTGFARCHGRLALGGDGGVQLVDDQGLPVQLTGVATDNLLANAGCYTRDSLAYVVGHWGVTVIRVSVDPADNQTQSTAKLEQYVQWTEELGIYIVVAWNANPEDSGASAPASEFFGKYAAEYATKEHVLYSISAPFTMEWDFFIAFFASSAIPAIRRHDKAALVIVGTPDENRDIARPITRPLGLSFRSNVLYAFTYTPGDAALLPLLQETARDLPVIVSTWSPADDLGGAGAYLAETEAFLAALEAQNISWLQAGFSDAGDAASMLVEGACARGDWDDTACPGTILKSPVFPENCGVTQAPETVAPETVAPLTEAPPTRAPETVAPLTDAPETVAPLTEAPPTRAPETVAPPTDAPETVAPLTDAPPTRAPETVSPPTDAPDTVAPLTDAPPTRAPETVAPLTDAPDTVAPLTDAPPTRAPETVAPLTDAPDTVAPLTDAPDTVAPLTDAPPTRAPETVAPLTDAPDTVAPLTDAPPTRAPETVAPPTDAPETVAPLTDAPPTRAPETVSPPTDAPDTVAPLTDAPPTRAPETVAPPTDAPETVAPLTEAPPTRAPETAAPPTDAPDTVAPLTDAPPTRAPETVAPLTEAPPTRAPATAAPPTDAPDTVAPLTDAPPTRAPETAAPLTDAPDTVAPLTEAPPTLAPPTSAPETIAPETDAPPTSAPDTLAPETFAPLTDAPPTLPPKTLVPTAAPVTHSPSMGTCNAWATCSHDHDCCPLEYPCRQRSAWYAQCRSNCPRGWLCSYAPPPPSSACQVVIPVWGQCAQHTNCCAPGTCCYRQNWYYAQCRPAGSCDPHALPGWSCNNLSV
ncbi:Endoglucanase [Diplonema papillatum]|nr:Endoglucanase [Diplonema papillatum]